mmetsp:Transcript_30739/g.89760  ORF Transcript_30739/g.89760 Transcript_30739/m.89760 type:complete len:206 (+) Transcript_30739:109-726(+)
MPSEITTRRRHSAGSSSSSPPRRRRSRCIGGTCSSRRRCPSAAPRRTLRWAALAPSPRRFWHTTRGSTLPNWSRLSMGRSRRTMQTPAPAPPPPPPWTPAVIGPVPSPSSPTTWRSSPTRPSIPTRERWGGSGTPSGAASRMAAWGRCRLPSTRRAPPRWWPERAGGGDRRKTDPKNQQPRPAWRAICWMMMVARMRSSRKATWK